MINQKIAESLVYSLHCSVLLIGLIIVLSNETRFHFNTLVNLVTIFSYILIYVSPAKTSILNFHYRKSSRTTDKWEIIIPPKTRFDFTLFSEMVALKKGKNRIKLLFHRFNHILIEMWTKLPSFHEACTGVTISGLSFLFHVWKCGVSIL